MKYILHKSIDAKITIDYILKRLSNDIVKAILQKRSDGALRSLLLAWFCTYENSLTLKFFLKFAFFSKQGKQRNIPP